MGGVVGGSAGGLGVGGLERFEDVGGDEGDGGALGCGGGAGDADADSDECLECFGGEVFGGFDVGDGSGGGGVAELEAESERDAGVAGVDGGGGEFADGGVGDGGVEGPGEPVEALVGFGGGELCGVDVADGVEDFEADLEDGDACVGVLPDLLGGGGGLGELCDALVLADEALGFGGSGGLGADGVELGVECAECGEDAGEAVSGGGRRVGLVAHGGLGHGGGGGGQVVGGRLGGGVGLRFGVGGWLVGLAFGEGVFDALLGAVTAGVRCLGVGVLAGGGLDLGAGGGARGGLEDEALGVLGCADAEGDGVALVVGDGAEVVECGSDGGEVLGEEGFEGRLEAGVVEVEGAEAGAACDGDGACLGVECGVACEGERGGVVGVVDAEPAFLGGVGGEGDAGVESGDGVPDGSGRAAELGWLGDGDPAWGVDVGELSVCEGCGAGERDGGGGDGAWEVRWVAAHVAVLPERGVGGRCRGVLSHIRVVSCGC